MKYKPCNHSAKELLLKAGFISANRGFVLPRTRIKPGSPVQIHALVDLDGVIDLHEDHVSGIGHISKKHTGRIERFIQLLEKFDNDEPIVLGDKMRRNYANLVLFVGKYMKEKQTMVTSGSLATA